MCLYFIISHTSVMFLLLKKICELTHNYGIIHTYFKVNPVITLYKLTRQKMFGLVHI
jgi:hypothetical protein